LDPISEMGFKLAFLDISISDNMGCNNREFQQYPSTTPKMNVPIFTQLTGDYRF